jgi:hypothetical protein
MRVLQGAQASISLLRTERAPSNLCAFGSSAYPHHLCARGFALIRFLINAAVGTFGIRPDEEENIFEFFGACCTARCAFVLSCQKRSLGICVAGSRWAYVWPAPGWLLTSSPAAVLRARKNPNSANGSADQVPHALRTRAKPFFRAFFVVALRPR